jgi:hypothetical protein
MCRYVEDYINPSNIYPASAHQILAILDQRLARICEVHRRAGEGDQQHPRQRFVENYINPSKSPQQARTRCERSSTPVS